METQGLFEAIMDSAVLLDKTGRVVNWNNGATQLFGYSKKEVIGCSINLIYDRNYPFPKLIQETLNNTKRWHEETAFIKKNGSKGTCKSYLHPIPSTQEQSKPYALLIHQNLSLNKKNQDELHHAYLKQTTELNNLIIALLATNTLLKDATQQQELSERKLRESELRFHLLAENATDVISRHMPDGTYLYVSPACKYSIGYSPDDLVGRKIHKFVHHEDLSRIKQALMRRRENANTRPIIYRIKRKDGDFRWFESNIRLIFNEGTRGISEIQLASRDITDRVLDKKARLRGQQLAHVFRLSTMEEMASGMAHEISQPLAAIVNYTRGCVRHLQNPQYDRDQLKTVMEKAVIQAERAGEIVQRLKNFFCKGQLVKTHCKINNVIRETVNLMKNELNNSKTKIDFEFDKNVPYTFFDKIQIQQVMLNLMQNAIEAMQGAATKDKRIHIQTCIHGKTIEVTISDTGTGFSREILNKVFKPFFTTKAHGRGMGLAICRSIIEAHGGEFTLNPNSNGNSWIRFSLPISL